MKVNIEIIPSPMVTGFTMFERFKRQEILDKKIIFVDAYMRSKTIVSTSFQVGAANMGISWPVGNYNFHNKEVYNFADFEKVPVSYFKLSKKQGLDQYKEYLKELAVRFLESMNIRDEHLDEITLRLYQPKFN